jgi:putative two-component system response regulator
MPQILIVDDDHFMLSLVGRLLEGSGHCVFQADHGDAAVEVAGRERLDLILLDLLLPGEDGYSVCRRIKAIPAQRSVPVVFLTGMRGEEYADEGHSAGGVACVVKPFEPRTLLKCIESHLPPGLGLPPTETRPNVFTPRRPAAAPR